MRSISILFLFITALLSFACSKQSSDTSSELSRQPTIEVTNSDPSFRTIANGNLSGSVQENGSYAWQSIPYAKPPVGELRWKLPQAIDPWQGVLEANKIIQPCPQFPSNLSSGIEAVDGIAGSEDCLYLSVYAPANSDSNSQLPVMYWIFGGGNNSGYAGDYNAAALAESQQVVVVTVNYRLGPLGWFLHPAIIDDGAEGAERSGNWSTVDTIRGLEWVQENISVFGGNPENVTIFGESAGGGNVMSLVTSPMAKGLFHRAIVQSGGIGTTSVTQGTNYLDDEVPGHFHSGPEIVNKILIRDGKAENRTAAKALQQSMSKQEIKELLYSQEAASFLKLFNPSASRNYPAPKKFTDGTVFVTTPPLEQLASGNYNQVPMILGTNRDERRIYMLRDPNWTKVQEEDPAEYIRVAKYPSDAWKVRGVDGLARIMSRVQGDNIYAFRFDWDEEAVSNGRDLSIGIGAAHSIEMAFVFGNWDVGFTPKEILYDPSRNQARDKLSAQMSSYWANFAYTGSPDKGRSDNQVEWQAWKNDDGAVKMIILDTEADGGIRMSSEEVTLQSIKTELLADTFSSQKNHCDAYVATFARTSEFNADEYATLGQEGCGKFPLQNRE